MKILILLIIVWLGYKFFSHISKISKIMKILTSINEVAKTSPDFIKETFDMYCDLKNEKLNKNNVARLINGYIINQLGTVGYELDSLLTEGDKVETYFNLTKITIFETLKKYDAELFETF